MMRTVNDVERKDKIKKLIDKGLTIVEIAEHLNVSNVTAFRDIHRFGLKTQRSKNSWKDIGDDVFFDYQNGLSKQEIAKKYNRSIVSVTNFISHKKKINIEDNDIEEYNELERCLELYRNKIQKIKKNIKIGDKVWYTKKLREDDGRDGVTKMYTVLQKYDRFVLLQGTSYQITARYEELLKKR